MCEVFHMSLKITVLFIEQLLIDYSLESKDYNLLQS